MAISRGMGGRVDGQEGRFISRMLALIDASSIVRIVHHIAYQHRLYQ